MTFLRRPSAAACLLLIAAAVPAAEWDRTGEAYAEDGQKRPR